MPRSQDLAEVVVNGQRYRDWTSVAVERDYGAVASIATLTVVESGSPAKGWTSLRLKPGDAAQVYLAGKKVIDGFVSVRGPSFNAQQHGIQIVVASKIQDIVKSSVEIKPGEFKNQTFSQITKSVLKPFGIDLSMPDGVPAGADKPFPKINMLYGETVLDFVDRLSRLRNLYLRDDEHGALVATRATGSGDVVAELQEGRNILAASGSIRDDNVLGRFQVSAQQPGSDKVWADDARDVSAQAQNGTAKRYSYGATYLEEPGDKDDARMRADREMAQSMVTAVDISITVRGWQMDDGSLWIEHIGKPVSVVSPRLFADIKTDPILIRGVVHRQSNPPIGTKTDIQLCLASGLGAQPRPDVGAVPNLLSPGDTSATPDGEDT